MEIFGKLLAIRVGVDSEEPSNFLLSGSEGLLFRSTKLFFLSKLFLVKNTVFDLVNFLNVYSGAIAEILVDCGDDLVVTFGDRGTFDHLHKYENDFVSFCANTVGFDCMHNRFVKWTMFYRHGDSPFF